jgi:general secretion pathway protein D
MQDLENIQAAIEVLSIPPQQVTIEAKFAEVTQRDTKGLGFDWALGNFLLGSGRMIGSAGTQPSFAGQPSAANPIGTFPGTPGVGQQQGGGGGQQGQINQGTLILPASTDGLLTGGLRNQVGLSSAGSLPSLFSLTGILTDPQFRMVLRALEQRDGVDVLSAPRVTTLSGRQAHVEVTDMATIVTGVNVGQTGAGGGGGGGAIGGTTAGVGSFSVPGTQALPLGPTLDVLPYVSADGFSIQMTLIPSFVEFIGYDDPGPFIPQVQSVSGTTIGVPLTTVLPLPRSRLRSVVTSCVVWDGQTIMLGGLISEDVRNLKDKVPVIGDLPLFGRFFRSETKTTFKKNLIIFVTPTIIDPAGNRVHRDEELPFNDPVVPGKPWPPRNRNYRMGW